jgi:hypothetical protein
LIEIIYSFVRMVDSAEQELLGFDRDHLFFPVLVPIVIIAPDLRHDIAQGFLFEWFAALLGVRRRPKVLDLLLAFGPGDGFSHLFDRRRLTVSIQVDVIILPWDLVVIAHVIRLLDDDLLGSWPLKRLLVDTFWKFCLLWGAFKLGWLGPLTDRVYNTFFCVFAALSDLAYPWLHLSHRGILQCSILFNLCLDR